MTGGNGTAPHLDQPAQAPEPEKKVPCVKCKKALTKGQSRRTNAGIICSDQRPCRQRVLSVELGIDLFVKYPRERVLFQMDPRPADAPKTWRPIFDEDHRVMHGWIYYSWCWPVGLPYAVQIHEGGELDDELIRDRYGKVVAMSQERLGKILGISQPNISRATKRLAERKLLRVVDEEGGLVYPFPKPAITPEERDHISTDIPLKHLGEALNTIPRKYRHLLADLLRDAPEDISTDMIAEALGVCTAYNEAHRDIRTTRDSGLKQACTRAASLLSRPLTFRRAPSSSSGAPTSKASPTSQPTAKDDNDATLNELYEAGFGKGALAKLPPKPERPEALIAAALIEIGIKHPETAAINLLTKTCRTAAQDCTAAEIAEGVRIKGPVAITKSSPMGFLISAVPNLFADGGLDRVRDQVRRAPEIRDAEILTASPGRFSHEEIQGAMDRQNARDILSSPESTKDEIEWARNALGVPEEKGRPAGA